MRRSERGFCNAQPMKGPRRALPSDGHDRDGYCSSAFPSRLSSCSSLLTPLRGDWDFRDPLAVQAGLRTSAKKQGTTPEDVGRRRLKKGCQAGVLSLRAAPCFWNKQRFEYGEQQGWLPPGVLAERWLQLVTAVLHWRCSESIKRYRANLPVPRPTPSSPRQFSLGRTIINFRPPQNSAKIG